MDSPAELLSILTRRAYLSVLGAGGASAAGCTQSAPRAAKNPHYCPPYPEPDADLETVCAWQAEAGSVHLTTVSDATNGGTGTVSFRLVNDSETDVTYGPDLWMLLEHTTNGWVTRIPRSGFAGAAELSAGKSLDLLLEVGARSECADETLVQQYETCPLPPGDYLFGIEGKKADGTVAMFLAMFSVTGE